MCNSVTGEQYRTDVKQPLNTSDVHLRVYNSCDILRNMIDRYYVSAVYWRVCSGSRDSRIISAVEQDVCRSRLSKPKGVCTESGIDAGVCQSAVNAEECRRTRAEPGGGDANRGGVRANGRRATTLPGAAG